jgi:formylglycine-generating enzyme required for sulfatase activity
MIGNVYEWSEDDFHNSYTGAPINGSAWVDTPRGTNRVLRGGSWGINFTSALRSSNRNDNPPTSKNIYFGFRCAQ